jgi:hypothetical protein
MRPRTETIDEAIDRVAASLTAVRDDDQFVARLETRLDAQSPRTRPLWLIAAPASAAMILGVLVSFNQNAPQRAAINTALATTALGAPTAVPSDVVEKPAAAEQHVVRARLELAHTAPDAIRQIAALNQPQTLSVNALVFESLTIDPVTEPGLLALPSLEVRGIDAVVDQKEQ